MERSVYFWEAGFDPNVALTVAQVAPRLQRIGATHALVKVGVDGRDAPILWTRAGAGGQASAGGAPGTPWAVRP